MQEVLGAQETSSSAPQIPSSTAQDEPHFSWMNPHNGPDKCEDS